MTLLCDVIVDNDFALSYAEVRRFCAAEAVKVNGEVVKDYAKPVQVGDVIEVGRKRKTQVW